MQGFDTTRRLTLLDLVARLRMRLSEPHPGTWGTVEYSYDESESQEINELMLMINEAQEYLCRDLYDRKFAFFETEFQHPAYPETTHYLLPPNFMAIESIFHHKGTDFSELNESHIKELQKYDAYGSYAYYSYGDFYSHYEVRGNMGETLFEGQVPLAASSSETDVSAIDDLASDVQVGDTVTNVTDGSVGEIIEKTANGFSVDALTGGRTDTFEPGDIFCIESQFHPYEQLHVWPKIRSVQEDSLYEGEADNGWKLETPHNPTRLRFRVDTLPSDINAKTDRLFAVIQAAGETEASVSGVVNQELTREWNTVDVSGSLLGDTRYYASVVTNDGTAKFTPARIELYESTGKDYLKVTYTRLPRPLQKPDDICEFPPYCSHAILAYARLLAYMKKTGMPQVDPNMLSDYKSKVEDIQMFLRKRGESGNSHNMFTNPHSQSQSFRHPWVYPGFTTDVRFP